MTRMPHATTGATEEHAASPSHTSPVSCQPPHHHQPPLYLPQRHGVHCGAAGAAVRRPRRQPEHRGQRGVLPDTAALPRLDCDGHVHSGAQAGAQQVGAGQPGQRLVAGVLPLLLLSLCGGARLRDGWRDPLRSPACCREDFFSKVGVAAGDEGAMEAMHAFCTAFSGVLAEVQQFLAENGLDDPAKV